MFISRVRAPGLFSFWYRIFAKATSLVQEPLFMNAINRLIQSKRGFKKCHNRFSFRFLLKLNKHAPVRAWILRVVKEFDGSNFIFQPIFSSFLSAFFFSGELLRHSRQLWPDLSYVSAFCIGQPLFYGSGSNVIMSCFESVNVHLHLSALYFISKRVLKPFGFTNSSMIYLGSVSCSSWPRITSCCFPIKT